MVGRMLRARGREGVRRVSREEYILDVSVLGSILDLISETMQSELFKHRVPTLAHLVDSM
jgi:hypothetical protein